MIPSRLLLPALLCLSLAARPGEIGATEGMVLPELSGGELAAEELAEGPVILVFWASWSPRCRDIAPRVEALYRRWSAKARVVTVVFQEEPAEVRAFLAGKRFPAPVYLDTTGSFSKKYAIATLPALLVLADGEASFRGKLPVHPDTVIERALE